MMSHLIKMYAVCQFSYFRLWYLKSFLFPVIHLEGNYKHADSRPLADCHKTAKPPPPKKRQSIRHLDENADDAGEVKHVPSFSWKQAKQTLLILKYYLNKNPRSSEMHHYNACLSRTYPYVYDMYTIADKNQQN